MKTQILSLLCCLFAWLLPVQAQQQANYPTPDRSTVPAFPGADGAG